LAFDAAGGSSVKLTPSAGDLPRAERSRSKGLASSQLRGIGSLVSGAKKVMSRVTSTFFLASANRTVADPRTMGRYVCVPEDGVTGRKYCGISAGRTGRWTPVMDLAAGDAPPVEVTPAATGDGTGRGAEALIGSMRTFICSLVSGPRRYDMAHLDVKTVGPSSLTLCIRNTLLPRPAIISSIFPRSNLAPVPAEAPSSASSIRSLSLSVCSRPMNQVPVLDRLL